MTMVALLAALVAWGESSIPAAAEAGPLQAVPATPGLIERDVRSGALDRDTGLLYLAYALAEPERLPSAYRSPTPWRGTLPLLRLNEVLAVPPAQPGSISAHRRSEIEGVLRPAEPAPTPPVQFAEASPDGANRPCQAFAGATSHVHVTEHFYIEYDAIGGGLTIDDYANSLEGAWAKEVGSFGWAAPPQLAVDPAPGNRYHVRIESFGGAPVYGLVTTSGRHGGFVGDNPSTAWPEPDAYASCMVVNDDLAPFPGTSRQALDATTAHEFTHAIQYGYGALSGPNRPDENFVEGMATWAEDEVYDTSNDVYNYLWPTFDDDMGAHDGDPYAYWVTWRGLFERYGTGVAGGGEDVAQEVWERISQHGITPNGALMLDAVDQSLRGRRTTLADAYHAYAVAVKFNKACGGGYAYPYCLEEGPAYVAARGPTLVHHTVSAPGAQVTGSIEDHYALKWVRLPGGTQPYAVGLANSSPTGIGALRGTVACDTGTELRVAPLPAVVTGGQATTLPSFDPAGCQAVVAVVTNQAHAVPNPGSSTLSPYVVSAAPAVDPPDNGTPPATDPDDPDPTDAPPPTSPTGGGGVAAAPPSRGALARTGLPTGLLAMVGTATLLVGYRATSAAMWSAPVSTSDWRPPGRRPVGRRRRKAP